MFALLLQALEATEHLWPDAQTFLRGDGRGDVDVEDIIPLRDELQIGAISSAEKIVITWMSSAIGQYSAMTRIPAGYSHPARRISAASRSTAVIPWRNVRWPT